MKRVVFMAALTMIVVSMFSCGESQPKVVASQGAAYEVFVVCPSDKWEGLVGDTLRAIMLQSVEMINQKEPLFDILRIEPKSFSGLVTKHRNIMIVKTGDQYTEPSMTAQYDVYAKPQIVVTVSALNNEQLIDYMWTHHQELQKIFDITERNRTLAYNAKYNEAYIEKDIKEKFGFSINIPKGYTVRNKQGDFMWISYELPQASQGVFFYSYPYTGKEDFTLKPLIKQRNMFAKKVPGPSDGSYMITSEVFVPEVSYQRINGRFWAIMRGFWDVQGDYMGGPFVNYSTLDVASNRVVTMDVYLFSPKQNKRNYLHELEALIYSVKFPDDK